ncbi:MAG TPA: hypothetical protein VN655_13210 [Pseudolabrys sp.]|jgi:hypothetical protein|nr:hypothetical protein [Pseudolabrys sp.]
MRLLLLLASVFAVAAMAAPAAAQDPGAPDANAKPVTTLKPETFSLPPSAYDTGKFNYTPPQPGSGGFNPGRVDLGDSVLQFNAKRDEPANRVGIEAIDPKRLGGITKDSSSPLPNYFGMTLSKPLN